MQKYSINIILGLIFFSIIVIVGCDDTITNSDIDNKIIPDNNVSFKEHIRPLLQVKCANSGCHNDSDRGGFSNYSVSTWASITSNTLYLLPYDPENSSLVWAIEGNSANPMPPVGYPPLTTNQIDGIKTWILEGADNN
ncbi:MAG: hypothetical protein JEY94_00165 [Melioribacteraceae bacterium]|nr:hypothetical protein [Melioribacteraceae bacterium]